MIDPRARDLHRRWESMQFGPARIDPRELYEELATLIREHPETLTGRVVDALSKAGQLCLQVMPEPPRTQ